MMAWIADRWLRARKIRRLRREAKQAMMAMVGLEMAYPDARTFAELDFASEGLWSAAVAKRDLAFHELAKIDPEFGARGTL